MKKVLLFANSDWYLYNFRLPLARAIRESGAKVLLAAPRGIYAERLKEAGFDFIPAPMDRRSLNPLSELRTVWWLNRFIFENKIDLVHGFTLKSAIYAGLAVRIANRTSVAVLAIAGLGFTFSSPSVKARLLRPIIRGLLKSACTSGRHCIIVQNQDDETAISDICGRENVFLIRGSGVNGDLFKSPERSPNAKFTVLFAARLLRSKGILNFLRAAKEIKEEGFDIDFIVAGTPDPGNPDSCDAAELSFWDSIGCAKFLGHVERMQELLAISHAVALPTTYGEGVPRILVEAAFSECGIIASDTSGCRELVLHEQTGLLIDPKNPNALKDAIVRLYHDRSLLKTLSTAARQSAKLGFSEHSVITETLQVYGSLLSPAQ